MEDPVAEIPTVIHLLTQSPPSLQQTTLTRYFTPNASFTHPFCRTGSYDLSPRFPPSSRIGSLLREDGPLPAISSRALTAGVYRWYKILSPTIELDIDSVAFDPKMLVLYVSLHQVFQVPWIPFYRAPVSLVTVLQLERAPASEKTAYLIKAQNDRYQVEEWITFVSVFRVLWGMVMLGGFLATMACVLGQAVLQPVVRVEERWGAKKAHEGAERIEGVNGKTE